MDFKQRLQLAFEHSKWAKNTSLFHDELGIILEERMMCRASKQENKGVLHRRVRALGSETQFIQQGTGNTRIQIV